MGLAGGGSWNWKTWVAAEGEAIARQTVFEAPEAYLWSRLEISLVPPPSASGASPGDVPADGSWDGWATLQLRELLARRHS